MKDFARGQRSRLDALTSSLDLTVGLKIEAPGLAFDFCCFGLDQNGKLSDDRFFVFYNQPAAPANAIEKAASGSDNESFRVRLEKLPSNIRRLVFTASIDGAGTMSQIRGGHLRLCEPGGAEVMRYEFSGSDFGSEGALMLGEIYWKDGWRFWAVGQGFQGNLSALLKYFGGEETSDSAASAPQAAQATPQAKLQATPQSVPPPPLSPPAALVSTSVAPALAPPVVALGSLDGVALQKLIDEAPLGGTVQIGPGEFAGPVVIRRPLTLQGAGGVIWAQAGPVVTVAAANVSLRDVEIEVTDSEGNTQGYVALLAQPGTAPALHNLRVMGRVLGVDGASEVEAARWWMPRSLDLGEVPPRVANSYLIGFNVPVACSLSCTVAGVSLEPTQLQPGVHDVQLWAREVPPESLLCGRIEVRAGPIVRWIPLVGRSAVLGSPPVLNRKLHRAPI